MQDFGDLAVFTESPRTRWRGAARCSLPWSSSRASCHCERWWSRPRWLTLALVMLGAYVRLTNAGLGCPDWPGCYGKLSPTLAAEEDRSGTGGCTRGPVSLPKAWKEMVHRYLASLVGVMILAIAWQALRGRRRGGYSEPKTAIGLPLALVLLVVLAGVVRHVDGDAAAQAGDRDAASAGRHDAAGIADLAVGAPCWN